MGGRESGRPGDDKYEQSCFRDAVSRIAVAQLCGSIGYQRSQLSAVDTLSELAVRYICDAGKAALFYANLAGRSSCSEFDVLQALEDMNDPLGGLSDADTAGSFIGSGLVHEIARYLETIGDIPFAGSLPRFPVPYRVKHRASFSRSSSALPGKHVPEWLPAFPDPHTYVQTAVWNERQSNPKEEKIEQARQRRKAERSLLNLQQRLASAASGAAELPNKAETKKEIVTTVANTPITLMMPSDDIEMQSLPLNDGIVKDRRPSLLNVFMPAIEALENGTLNDGNKYNHVPPPTGGPVCRFGIHKKTLDTQIYLGIRSSGDSHGWADEKDDKKRRAQLIIREAMENPQELHQL